MKKLAAFLLILLTQQLSAQINIIPMPAEVKAGDGTFVLNNKTVIVLEGSNLEKTAQLLNGYLKPMFGYTLKVATKASSPNAIILNYERLDNDIAGAYNLTVDKNGIYIAGDNETGVFYGLQTLLQLLDSKNETVSCNVPYVTINDHPRFAYRGMHFDVARHFFPVEFVKKYIDYLAAYKFNTLHWHLTDDQGWRIEIKKYPKLTAVGGYRNGTIIGRYPGKANDSIYYGGFYTQAQIKDVVKYAADRHITIIPEIEMPGHASAAIAAYPQLSCFPDESTKVPDNTIWAGSTTGKQVQQTWGVFEDVFCPSEYTFTFMENVLDEVTQLFPSKYIHIGGDESPTEAWKRSAFCQQLIKDKNLKDEHELQSYFIQRIEKYINSKGRHIIGWDEILEGGLAPNATVMSWRGEEGGIAAAKQNHDVIMTPGTYCYLDHSQSQNEDSVTIGGYLPLEKVYSYDPVPTGLNAQEAKHILGAQGNVWTEYMGNSSKVEYMIFPRLAALSEILWTPKEKKDWDYFERRLPSIFDRFDEQKINYSKAYYDLQTSILPTQDFNGVLWKLESKNKPGAINYYVGGEIKHTYKEPILINSNQYNCAKAEKKGTPAICQSFHFNKATGKKIILTTQPNKSYPGDGAFTLVNSIQNTKGLARSSEFLGFLGKDCEGDIDLGEPIKIKKVRFHIFQQSGSWIYPPKYVEINYGSKETGTNKIAAIKPIEDKSGNIIYEIDIDDERDIRFLNFKIINYGIIPQGNPGAGNVAWLFVDEIEVE
jgi:hexosaminidase